MTLVIGVDLALAWRDTNPLYVLGGVLLGGARRRGAAASRTALARARRPPAGAGRRAATSTRASREAFFTASLLFCVGPLTVVGAIQDGLTGDYEALATKALLDGFASIALAASARARASRFAALSVLVDPGRRSRSAPGSSTNILAEGSEALAALTSAGGVLIIGITLKLLDVKDVQVGNFLPALRLRAGARRRSSACSAGPTPLIVGTSRRKPGVRTSCDRPHRRRALDVERHAVALLDGDDRRVLAAPGERPDDREAGRDPRDLRDEERRATAGGDRATAAAATGG